MPRDENEISALGFPVLKIDEGQFVRVKLQEWSNRTDEISSVFDYLMAKYPATANELTIEFYRSQSELHLLIPLREKE